MNNSAAEPWINKWLENLNLGVLSVIHFREYWETWVPKIYKLEPTKNCLDWTFDEKLAQEILYNSLEKFIYNKNQAAKPTSSVCGRVLKNGEPYYQFREHEAATSVLCVDCFEKLNHNNLTFQLRFSQGSDCCGCGDTGEAWKEKFFCKTHTGASKSNKLSEDVIARAKITFEAILKYCYDLLSMEDNPSNLVNFSETEDTYCTILYENKFYPSARTNILSSYFSKADAVKHKNIMCQEGRTIIKFSNFHRCNALKMQNQHPDACYRSVAFEISVEHSRVVSHQIFALKLLEWLENFIGQCDDFRLIFNDIALSAGSSDTSIIEKLLLRNHQMWTSGRIAWSRLLIAGFPTQTESKKALAIVFIKNYEKAMKYFISGKFDHSPSMLSLSKYLFVPTWSHLLIANHDALSILLNTFVSESSKWCYSNGKLEFESGVPIYSFVRAQYVLQDLWHLLRVKPENWTDELRRNFLKSFPVFLQLLTSMQNMNSVVRRFGQYVESEPNWKPAFSFQLQLSCVIRFFIQWCSADRVVFIETLKLTLKELGKQQIKAFTNSQKVADHIASCIKYDVAELKVSIHVPLSRFLSGLLSHLKNFNFSFDDLEIKSFYKPSLVELMEPVLRVRTMISQVHAGMWKQNGPSITNQIKNYGDINIRQEMLDKDILLLQIVGLLIESNEFVIHILNKFNLVSWAQEEFENSLDSAEEDSIKQTISLVEEFLELLIVMIGERYVPEVAEVTAADCLKREIIHQLSIKPMKQNELANKLVNDVFHRKEVRRVIYELADFKETDHVTYTSGVHELRAEFFSDYNVFFIHYTKEERCKSEKTQRERLKKTGSAECFPPPKSPKLTKLFTPLLNLLQCDVVLSIMKTVLSRSADLEAKSFSKGQLHRILHLIGIALQEQETGNYKFLSFTEKATKWNIYKLLENLNSSPRVVEYKALLSWVLEKYRLVAGYPSVASESLQTNKLGDSITGIIEGSSLQKSTAEEKEQSTKTSETVLVPRFSTIDSSEGLKGTSIALGRCQTTRCSLEKSYTCVICNESQAVTAENECVMILAVYIQQSTVLYQQQQQGFSESTPLSLENSAHIRSCNHAMHASCWEKYFDKLTAEENHRTDRLSRSGKFDFNKNEYLCPSCNIRCNTVLPVLPPLEVLQPSKSNQPDLSFENWLQIMGSVVECKTTSKNVKLSHDKNCRYCKTLSDEKSGDAEKSSTFFSCPIEAIISQGSVGKTVLELYNQAGPRFSQKLTEVIGLFARANFTKELECEPNKDDALLPLSAWKSISYTIHTAKFRNNIQFYINPFYDKDNLINFFEALARVSAGISVTRSSVEFNHALDCLERFFKNLESNHSILSWDPFGMLVTLVSSLPNLLSHHADFRPAIVTGNVVEQHAVRLVLTALVVKILLTTNFNKEREMDEDYDLIRTFEIVNIEEESNTLFKLMKALNVQTEIPFSEIWKKVKESCLPFLRCCVFYFHYLTGVPAPDELTKKDGDTFDNMCRYLGLPDTYNELFDSEKIIDLAIEWSKHPGITNNKDKASLSLYTSPKLIELPVDHRKLIKIISTFTCPKSSKSELAKDPAICLVCGEVLCSFCSDCQYKLDDGTVVGSCMFHASKCGAGIGVFLRVRINHVNILKTPDSGVSEWAPYLDEFGELDVKLSRGYPLKFNKKMYQNINDRWLSHTLDCSIKNNYKLYSNAQHALWKFY